MSAALDGGWQFRGHQLNVIMHIIGVLCMRRHTVKPGMKFRYITGTACLSGMSEMSDIGPVPTGSPAGPRVGPCRKY